MSTQTISAGRSARIALDRQTVLTLTGTGEAAVQDAADARIFQISASRVLGPYEFDVVVDVSAVTEVVGSRGTVPALTLGEESYLMPPPSGSPADDKDALSEALVSGKTRILLGLGTYEFADVVTEPIVGKTFSSIARMPGLTTLKLADGHALDHLFVPSNTHASDTVFENLTFDGNRRNSLTTAAFCGLLKADATAVLTSNFKLRKCVLKNGRQQLVRLYPGSSNVDILRNQIENWEDVVFEITPWKGLKFLRNRCIDYGLNPYYASGTGPVLLMYGGARGAGADGAQIAYNEFIPVDRAPTVFTVTIASPAVFTLNGHGFRADQKIVIDSTGALATGLSIGAQIYVIVTGLTANTFQASNTQGGAAINTSGSQSGVHTLIEGQGQFAMEAVGNFCFGHTIKGNTLDAKNTATSIWAGTGISGAWAESRFNNIFQRGFAGSEANGYEINGPRNSILGTLHNGKVVVGGGGAAADMVGNVVKVNSYIDRTASTGTARNFDHIALNGDGTIVDGGYLQSIAGLGFGGWAVRVEQGAKSDNVIRSVKMDLGNDVMSGVLIDNTSGGGNTVEDCDIRSPNFGIATNASAGTTYVRNNKQSGASGAGGGIPLQFNGNTAVVSSGNLPRDGGLQSIAFHATTMSVDARAGSRVTFGTLTANVTAMAAPTNMPALPERIPFEFYMLQDGTGTRTFTWHSKFIGAFPTAAGTANQKQMVRAVTDGVNFLFVSSTGWYTAT